MTSPTRPGQPRLRLRRGVTALELMVGVAVVAMLGAVVLPRFGNAQRKSFGATMRADLRSLAVAQELSEASRGVYLDDVSRLQFSFSAGVQLAGPIVVTPGGWSARVHNPKLSRETCAVFHGTAAPVAPAVTEGVVACSR